LPERPASEASRLPAVAIPVMALEHALPLVAVAIPLLGISRFGRVLALVPLAFALVGPVVRWLRFRYTILGDVLVLEGGLLFHWRREIPFARIQSVDSIQKLRHQVLGVVELRVEVIGGRATEASFPALRVQEADRIRRTVLKRTHGPPEEQESNRSHLAHLGPRALLLAGATGGRVAVVALLLGYVQQFLPEDIATSLIDRLAHAPLAVVLGIVAGALLISVVLSLVATIVVYWNFTVRRDGDRVEITRGLLERRRAFIPLNRVQALRIQANPLRRMLGLASVSAVLAGYNAQKQEGEETSMVLPIARTEESFRIVAALLGLDGDLEGVHLERLSPRALVHRLAYAVVVGAAVGGSAWVLFGSRGSWAVVVIPLAAVWAWLVWRGVGYAHVGEHVIVRGGGLFRRLYVVPVANVQHLELSRSPVQRAFALATLCLRIPKASPGVVGLENARAIAEFRMLSAMLHQA
jgi:putative membrane protein